MNSIAIATLGTNILRFTMPLAASSSDLTDKFSGVINILNLVGLVLAFGGLLFAAVMFMMGQTERVLYGLVGAGIGGLSFIIIKVMFSTAGGSSDVDSLEMGSGTDASPGKVNVTIRPPGSVSREASFHTPLWISRVFA
ncbi:MAG: hypothetical protein R3F13_14760 [Prosthecobacter sp.]